MNNYQNRIYRYTGNPYEIGVAAGRALGDILITSINHYIAKRQTAANMAQLHHGALPWLSSLPQRFRDEFAGIAEGAHLPLQLLAEWAYVDDCQSGRCSGAVGVFNNHVWVARNNDTYVPELWGYAAIKEVDGRIPALSFGMAGDVFTSTGINRDKLWLHYNYLPVWDAPTLGKPHLPAYVFLTDALEVCRTIADVEAYLTACNRDSGMLLFAVDGKTDEYAVYECLCSTYVRRDPAPGWIVGTNHHCVNESPIRNDDNSPLNTFSRFDRMQTLVQDMSVSQTAPDLPADLIRILADDHIENRGSEFGTVFANVACPNSGEIWYTFGGYPAASKGNWQRLMW